MTTKHRFEGIIFFLLITMFQSCEKECTKTLEIGGGILPEETLEVPCDFAEGPPIQPTTIEE
jgi:hypothetical protein